jgi:putative transposase
MTRQPYQTDLTDAQWERREPRLPPAPWWGRPRTVSMREVSNAILYVTRTGIRWRDRPHDFPQASTVSYYLTRDLDEPWWEAIHDAWRVKVRDEAGRTADPRAVIIDSPSVKSTAIPGERGYDAGTQVTGRQRSVIGDTMGLWMRVVVHAADRSERGGGKQVAVRVQRWTTTIRKVVGDPPYGGQCAEQVPQAYGWEVAVHQRPADAAGLVVLPQRGVGERTLGWLTWYRRLAKDYEPYLDVSEAFMYISMIHLMLRRLKPAVTS